MLQNHIVGRKNEKAQRNPVTASAELCQRRFFGQCAWGERLLSDAPARESAVGSYCGRSALVSPRSATDTGAGALF